MCMVKGKHETHNFEIKCLDISLYTEVESMTPQLTRPHLVQTLIFCIRF